jgi:sterol desaturase/sphingolipid hydroxylase (fatty acid hydroxylase superfamily)
VSDPVERAIPFFVGLVVLEAVLCAWRRARGLEAGRGYELRDSAASLAMGLGSVAIGLVGKGVEFALYSAAFELRLFDLGPGPWVFAAALVADDFCYYWFHRLHHEVRLLWAAHVNHHSSRHFNLSTALRQPWTTFARPLFHLPLPLLGFDPLLAMTVHSLNLIYQFWIHTELVGRLGPLEWLFNTPSHHRVHHGRNVRYLDRNHGGIFIIWDRLFGTFEPERERVDYGLTKNLESFDPLRIAFHEWAALARDLRGACGWREVLRFALRPPGWRPGGGGSTARDLRRALGRSAA